MADKLNVSLLGTGTMGAGIASNVVRAGFPLRVWNRTRKKAEPLGALGATVAATPAEAVRGADVVITMLFDADSVDATMRQARDGLKQGAIWVQQSTVGADGADRLALLAADLGLVYVDAPVLGSRQAADDGTVVVLASGPPQSKDQVAPIFDVIGSRVLWVGAAGAGSRLKLASNAWVLLVVEGVAESLSLARELGVDPRLFLDSIAGGALDSPYVQAKGSAMLEGDFSPSFALAGAAKDAGLIVAAARQSGLELGVAEAARDEYRRAVEAGHGSEDLAATYSEHRPGKR
jgi:3-hydroxyisobutyrate dehydrogenase